MGNFLEYYQGGDGADLPNLLAAGLHDAAYYNDDMTLCEELAIIIDEGGPRLDDDGVDNSRPLIDVVREFITIKHPEDKMDILNNMNLRSRDRVPVTPLMVACQRKQLEVVRYLLANGADANLMNTVMETALYFAVRIDHLGIYIY